MGQQSVLATKRNDMPAPISGKLIEASEAGSGISVGGTSTSAQRPGPYWASCEYGALTATSAVFPLDLTYSP